MNKNTIWWALLLVSFLHASGCSENAMRDPKIIRTEEASPSWRPGTSLVAYSSIGAESLEPGVYVVDVDQPERTFLIPGCYAPTWSFDGRFLACQCSNGVLVLDYQSAERHVVPHTLGAYRVSWASDGASLIGELGNTPSTLGLWQFDASGLTAPRRITPSGMRAGMASWNAARNEIVFVSPGANDDADLFVIRPDGSGLRQLTHSPNTIEVYPEWSPDGRFIAYTERDGIWLMDASTLQRHRLEGTAAAHLDQWQRCSWSFDGARLAYNKTRLWVIDVTGVHNREVK